MKINRLTLRVGEEEILQENIDFSHIDFKNNQVREIKNCLVKAKAIDYGEILRVEIHIDALVVAICSYSLEDIELGIKIDGALHFSNDKDDDSSFYEDGNEIDLDPYILSLILSEVPIKVVKKGKKLPKGGEGYRVISEAEYREEKKDQKDSPFNVLDNLSLDE